jgi:iron complex transport system substrate-binding protein
LFRNPGVHRDFFLNIAFPQPLANVVWMLCALLLLFACGHGNEVTTTDDTKNQIRYAENLKIIEESSGISVTITHPDSKKKFRYFLSRKRNQPIVKGMTNMVVPSKRIIALSSTQVGMLSKLNVLSSLVAIANKNYVYNSIVLEKLESGQITDLQGDYSASTESILQCKADILLYSAFQEDFPKRELIERMGTICMPNFDWRETHPLGKAEWIKLFGYICGKEKEASAYFSFVEKQYNALRKKVINRTNKPTVFCGNLVGDIWYTPAGGSFFAAQLKDAGGKYSYERQQGSGSLSLSLEQIIRDQKRTSIWLDPGVSDWEALMNRNPHFRHLEAVQKKQVFCYSHAQNKYWELSAIEPHLVLKDLIAIFSGNPNEQKGMYFYRNIAR